MYTKEELNQKTLSELLEIYAKATISPVALERVRNYILSNFTEKPMTKLIRANSEIENMNLSKTVVSDIKEAKLCAAEIGERLDPQHISGLRFLKLIVAERIKICESRMALNAKIESL